MDDDNVASLQKVRNWLYHNIRVIDVCIFDNFSDFSHIFYIICFYILCTLHVHIMHTCTHVYVQA